MLVLYLHFNESQRMYAHKHVYKKKIVGGCNYE